MELYEEERIAEITDAALIEQLKERERKSRGITKSNDLFSLTNFKSHSGLNLNWRIECDALSDDEWFTISKMIMELTPPFSKALGIPRGGVKLAKLLNEAATGNEKDPICIVDDVLTTGKSMEEFLSSYSRNRDIPFMAIGWVVFARVRTPEWVTALFQMPIDDEKYYIEAPK